MKMKIVQLSIQSERSLSAENAFERYADVTLVQTETEQGVLRKLKSGDVDLLLCSPSDLSEHILATLAESVPDAQIIFLTSEEEQRILLKDPTLKAWDVVSASEMDRLPLSAMRAIQSRRERGGLRDSLTQARDLLLSCQKSIAVGRLLGSVAHEINNPLEAISNLLYLGQRNLSDQEETRKCFQLAEDELQRVGEITKQLLYFHRESKTAQKVVLSDVMESILTLYQNRLEMRSITVVRQYRSAQRLIAHPGELRQAFSNMIANAIDAMPRGGKLLIRIRDRSQCRLAVTVADTGHGISRETMRRLGELLFTTKGEAGTGLGLWVTYQLFAKYGGTVKVYSSARPGLNGAAFTVCFADSGLVVDDVERSGSTSMKHRARLSKTKQKDDESTDQSPKTA